jgi:NAD(P)-binding Rossmann-like domain
LTDVIVVGGGIFGQVAAATLRREGAIVEVLDARRPGAGSPPAGCVLRPSWLAGMPASDLDAAMMLLDELYGLRELELESIPLRSVVRCHRVEPELILGKPVIHGAVLSVGEDGSVHTESGVETPRVGTVVATGQWAQELTPWVGDVTGRWGWSHRGPPVQRNTVRVWAPYRQTVAFNMSDGRSWSGDAQALLEKSKVPDKEAKSRARCAEAVGCDVSRLETMCGARPYAAQRDTEPALLRRRGRVWSITGGAKNGTAAAAWAARRLVREMLG